MTVSIAPNNSGLYYSPGNWNVQASYAASVNDGAYIKTTVIASTSIVANFDISNMASPATQIWWRVDRYGPWTLVALTAGTVTLTIPTESAGWPWHFVEIYIKSRAYNMNTWLSVGAASGSAVIFTGLTLDNGASVGLPQVASKSILVFGDSITEGALTLSNTAPDYRDGSDALLSYSMQMAPLLGVEIGNVGFGAQGWNTGGQGNVPAFASAYNLSYAGVSRSFAGIDMVLINQGTNDGGDVTSYVTAVLNGLASAGFAGKIGMFVPFNGSHSAQLAAGIAAATNPAQTTLISTTGFFNTAISSDGLHPYGVENIVSIAPKCAAAVLPYLWPQMSLVFS